MEFGSKYVYTYSGSEEESVSEDEFETGIDDISQNPLPKVPDLDNKTARVVNDAAMALPPGSTTEKRSKKMPKWLSSLKSKKHPKPAPELHASSQKESVANKSSKSWRRADTNIVSIQFDQLTKPSNMHTGDSISCVKCAAIMSHISKLQETEDKQFWPCDFCGTVNSVEILPGEMSTLPDVTYMITPALSTTGSSCSGADESLVIFCMDTSGSMCVSMEIQGKLKLRGNSAVKHIKSLNTTGENQWLPGQNRNVTFVTRLQGLQAAVDHQLTQLVKDHPNRRVAIIAFNTEVTIYCNGEVTPVVVAGDKLHNYDQLVKIGTDIQPPANIKSSHAQLGKLIFNLEEGGQTALGPAMLIAVTMASKAAGSKVIMCTDGLANIGLGTLEDANDSQQYKASSDFYSKLGETAKDNGVTVSVLTIAGTNCQLVELGNVASISGGQVDIVDPLKLTEEFGNILANSIIAMHVTATFIVHSGLYIRDTSEKASCVTRDIGNVTSESEVTFEYGVRPNFRNRKADEISSTEAAAVVDPASIQAPAVSELRELPFQVQIRYTDKEGAVALRVLTKTQPFTTERQKAEKYINLPVVGCHAAQKSSSYAMEGAYTPSRLNAFMYQRLVARNAEDDAYDMYVANVSPLEQNIRVHQMAEASSRGCTINEYEDDDEWPGIGASNICQRAPSETTRKQKCSDSLSKEMYQKKSLSSKAFQGVSSESQAATRDKRCSEPSKKHQSKKSDAD